MADGDLRDGLLDDAVLEDSAVVANCVMNRERQLAGVNSYARELGFSPLEVLMAKTGGVTGTGTAAWLDLRSRAALRWRQARTADPRRQLADTRRTADS